MLILLLHCGCNFLENTIHFRQSDKVKLIFYN